MSDPVLSVQDLVVTFGTREGTVTAVNGVSFAVRRGEVLGLVGESGSGKSVTGLAVLGLIDAPGRVARGSIRLDGEELVGLPEEELRRLRGKRLAMIFQDPMNTLNPVLRIDTQMIEAVQATSASRTGRAGAGRGGARGVSAFPRRRSASAPIRTSSRAACASGSPSRPRSSTARRSSSPDEPTTALDVTIQAQILAEVQTSRRERHRRWCGSPTTSR
jgi:peptide/nickel transport system ATP-binding protein